MITWWKRWRAARYLTDHGYCPIHMKKMERVSLHQWCATCSNIEQGLIKAKINKSLAFLKELDGNERS